MATRAWGARLRRIHLSRSNLRYAIKTALSALVVWWSFDLMDVKNPVFALISVVFVAEPQLGTSLFLAWSRVLATVIGVATTLLVVVVLGVSPWALAVAILVVVLLCTEVFEMPGAWKLGPATCALIIALAAAGGEAHPGFAEAWRIALARFWETIYGIFVTVAISRLLWPEWSWERLRSAAVAYCRASSRRVGRLLEVLAGTGGGATDVERMAIISALRLLDATIIDARHERWHPDAFAQLTTTVLAASRAFHDSCVVVERLISHLAEGPADHHVRAATVEVLREMRDRLGRLAAAPGQAEGHERGGAFEAARRRLEVALRASRDGGGQGGPISIGLTGPFALAEAVLAAAKELDAVALALAAALPSKT